MQDAERLRALARWYREFAEKTGNPDIWDCRLQTADDLDAEADRIERTRAPDHPAIGGKMGRALRFSSSGR